MTAPKLLQNAQKPLKGLFKCALYCLCGAVFALPLIFPKLWFLAWFAASPVLYWEFAAPAKGFGFISAYFRGICFFIPYGLVAFQWFWSLYPLDFLGFSKGEAVAVILVAHLGIPLMQAVGFSLLFVCLHLLKRFTNCPPLLSSIFISCIWVVCEWGQTKTWLGVPWGRLAAGQIGFLPMVQSVSLFGSYFLSFLIILANSMLAYAFINRQKTFKKRAFCAVFALILVANMSYGAIRVAYLNNKIEKSDKVTVSALQGNITFEEKWKLYSTYTYDIYNQLAKESMENGSQIVIMPETAIPYDLSLEADIIIPYLQSLTFDNDTAVLCGVFNTDHDGKLYNSVICFEEGVMNDETYSKRRLVPFGEFVPMEDFTKKFFPVFANMVNLQYPLTAGADTAVMDTKYGKIGCAVCFDTMFDSLSLESVRDGAELIAVSTNDSWFDHSTAQAQNNTHTALRAIETGRFAVRAANTGLSTIISPTGKTIASAEPYTESYALGDVCFFEDNTLYTTVGNIIVPISLAMAIAIFSFFAISKRRRHDN